MRRKAARTDRKRYRSFGIKKAVAFSYSLKKLGRESSDST